MVIVVVAVVTWGIGTAFVAAGNSAILAGGTGTAFAAGTAATGASLTATGMATVGAIAGAVGGGLSSALAGGDLGDVLRASLIGGLSGAISGGMGNGAVSAFSAGNYALSAAHVVGHGVVGGLVNEAMGGKFQDGFLSAAASAAAGILPFGKSDPIGGLIKSGVVGGTASWIGGGKFSNGASMAAFQYLVSSGQGMLSDRSVSNFLTDVTLATENFVNFLYRKVTSWHFEDRFSANGVHPSYGEVSRRNSGWRKLLINESVFHDNGIGSQEEKFVHDRSGREAVFTSDKVFGGSNDGSLKPYTDPRYIASYNYVTTAPFPSRLTDFGGALRWAGTGIGHAALDMLPYAFGGNVRGTN